MKKQIAKQAAAFVVAAAAATFLPVIAPVFETAVTVEAAEQQVSYIDENGNTQTVTATVLTGSETSLGDSVQSIAYYVLNSDIAYTHQVRTVGNVELILADGCTMSFGTEEAPYTESGPAIGQADWNGSRLDIYGQSGNTGKIEVYRGSNRNGIQVSNYYQYGGNVKVRTSGGSYYGIYTNANLHIYGGSLDVQAEGEASRALISNVGINLYGGRITAVANGNAAYALHAENDIVINFENGGSLYANSFLPIGNVIVQTALVDTEGNYYLGTVNRNLLAGKTLTKASEAVYAVTKGSVQNGKLVIDKVAAAVGDTVTLTPQPANDYHLKSILVKGAGNTEYTVTNTNGTYSFTMPAENVTVSMETEYDSKYMTIILPDNMEIINRDELDINEQGQVLSGGGGSVILKIAPKAGYYVDGDVYCGASKLSLQSGGYYQKWITNNSDNSYTFTATVKKYTIAETEKTLDTNLSYCTDYTNKKVYILYKFTPADERTVADYDYIQIINKTITDTTSPDYIIKPTSESSYINKDTGFINTVFSSVKFNDDSVINAGTGSYIVGIVLNDTTDAPNTEKFDFEAVPKYESGEGQGGAGD